MSELTISKALLAELGDDSPKAGSRADSRADNKQQPFSCLSADKLSMGARARVIGYTDAESTVTKQLQQLGLILGVELTLRRSAPLGDPMEFHVRGYRLALRKKEAAQLQLMML